MGAVPEMRNFLVDLTMHPRILLLLALLAACFVAAVVMDWLHSRRRPK